MSAGICRSSKISSLNQIKAMEEPLDNDDSDEGDSDN